MTISILPVPGIPEIRAGDDLAAIVLRALEEAGLELEDGDVLAVTQKIVSKAEGRLVRETDGPGKSGWVERETVRVVARRGDLMIAETRHGLVCANAGVDASNVPDGHLTLLPEDPDASAERIRAAVASTTGARVAVVVTDTFGRPWREGLTNVAIGASGLPAIVDLRGRPDASGRVLDVTVVALADEIAAASGLTMGKSDGVPVAILRGIPIPDWAPIAGARALIRDPANDLFRRGEVDGAYPSAPDADGRP